MKNQTVIIPPIERCPCGLAAYVHYTDNDMWQVQCMSGHTMTKECGTKNRAIHRWNKRIKQGE